MSKKRQLMLWLLTILGLSLYSQRTITGTVTDSKNNPLSGANVRLKGTSLGAKTKTDGSYLLNIPQDKAGFDSVEISYIGFKKQTRAITGTIMDFSIEEDARGLSEVIVTAQGVRRKKNTLPYAATSVGGEEVSQTRQTNFVQNISGKSSGVEVRQSNTMGGSTNVVIRGNKSFTGSNQALFVVDGIPYNNNLFNDANQRSGRGGYDYGNTISDINPDDIENISILKGAAASALYGSMANNGVIYITTKKGGTKGKKGLGISVQSGLTLGLVDKSTFVKYQKEYGAGYGQYYGSANDPYFDEGDPFNTGTVSDMPAYYEDASYGGKFDPTKLVYQWDAYDPTSPNYKTQTPWIGAANDPSTFFENSTNLSNSIFVNGGGEDAYFKFGYTRNDEKGILPNSSVNKNAFDFSGGYNILKNLNFSANVNFTNTKAIGRYATGYNNNLMSNFRQWWQVNVDMEAQREAFFRNQENVTWNIASGDPVTGYKTPAYWDNPYWTRYKNYSSDNRNRWFGYGQLQYKPKEWLTLTGRASIDYFNFLQEERLAKGSLGGFIIGQTDDQPSGYGKQVSENMTKNYDFIANTDNDINADLNFKSIFGINHRIVNFSSILNATNGGLINPNQYSISNSVSQPNAAEESEYSTVLRAIYAGGTLTYKDMLTLDATLRRDQSSTLPEENNTYWYPSVSAGFIFSNWKALHGNVLNGEKTYGKIRANYAEVGNSAPFHSVNNTFELGTPINGASQITTNTTYNNANLKPERSKSWELGLDMSFYNSRLGFELTYYNTRTLDQILPVAVSSATGYTRKYVNSGEMKNEGVELSLFATPVKRKDLSWDFNINWTKNENTVVSLFEGVDNLQLASYQGGVTINATPGLPFGSIRGKDFVYTNGQRTVSATTGRYLMTTTTNNVIGNAQPNWLMGIQNKITYKNLSLSFLIDVRSGGSVFSLDMYYGLATGLPVETAGYNDLGNPLRASLAEGGGVILNGVLPDGTPNTKRISAENYGLFGYARNPNSAFVYDASYVKLREVVLSYKLPKSWFEKIALKNATVSLFARNLWIIHKNLPYADPEDILTAGNAQGYQAGSTPAVRNIGFNLKFGF